MLNAAPSALQPPFYFAAVAVGYGLMLPVLAVLHARHQRHRESGAILGTIAGTAAVVLGIIAAADAVVAPGALLTRGVWWWTVGKMWWETALLPRSLGIVTMGLAVFAFVGSLIPAFLTAPLDIVLGLWMLALAVLLRRAGAT